MNRLPRVRRVFAPLLLAAVSMAALTAPAFADGTKIRDRSGDGEPACDIVKVVVGHTKDGRIEHAVQIRRPGRYSLDAIQQPIRIGAGATKEPQFSISRTAVTRIRNGEYEEAGGVEFRRRGRWFVFAFDPESIGSPRKYRWQVLTALGGGHYLCDRVPNRRFRVHDLSKPPTPPAPKPLAQPTITSWPKGKTNRRKATLRFHSNSRGGRLQCKLTGKRVPRKLKHWRRCTSPKTYKNLKPGKKVFWVRELRSGKSSKPVRKRWKVVKKGKGKATITDIRTRKSKSFPVVLRRRR